MTKEEFEQLFGDPLSTVAKNLGDYEGENKTNAGRIITGVLKNGTPAQVCKLVSYGIIPQLWKTSTSNVDEMSIIGLNGLELLLKLGEDEEIRMERNVDGFGNAFVEEVEKERVPWEKEGSEEVKGKREELERLLEEVRDDKSLLVKG
uniref:Uncharacterized protein n=2 Tax=Paramoeba aestuarina TaxID=180227 RepID=A0A7S4PC02_9EUKA|mmetsp:Transcript_39846/g.62978  ORF Transcript_39846/g.62978 Transcript_39846/m.62978 type:complete len:148 (+) Transcript_39846:188-631(+)